MSHIQVLDKQIANKISAGEVVEKPASVVKELVENSLDAGADTVLIEIENGGINLISITDNGKGIEHDDVKVAFLPHATSKIKNLDDLFNIATLGFRGEALASISAVSEVEMTTKTATADLGSFIKLEGGEVVEFSQKVANQGTKIEVKNLFFNTPARKKFLRKPKAEEGDITSLVERLILANPNIKFKYIVDGKLLYNTSGSGCYDNIYTIYGKEIANNLLEVNYKNSKYHLVGYIGKPSIAKPNRTYQTLFVNKRIVSNFLISSAVGKAYEDFLMKGKFPFYVLNLTVPHNSVDVNVHPTKQEVKFDNTSEIYSLFLNAISDVLFNVNYINQIGDDITEKEILPPEKHIETAKSDVQKKPLLSKINSEATKSRFDILNKNEGRSFQPKSEIVFNSSTLLDVVELRLNDNTKKPKLVETKQENFAQNLSNFKIIGTLFSTYILLEQDDKLYFIDQHACHERKNYDKFITDLQAEKIATQPLFFPYVFDCNPTEQNFFLENQAMFKKLGFEIDEFGPNTLKISEIPYFLKDVNIGAIIEDIKSDLSDFNKQPIDLFKEHLAQKACKASVKAGDLLTADEIKALLADLAEHKVLLCPHGRPIIVEVTKYQIEKWFKRKV